MSARWSVSALAAVVLGALTACGGGVSGTSSAPPSNAVAAQSACLVSDVGGINDRSFNQTTMAGVTRAASEFGVRPVVLESTTASDYPTNLATFVDQGCSIIISVGYLLAEATKAAANANPDVPFTIVDYTFGPGEISADNVLGQTFRSDEAAFLAGYLAAGLTRTGTVGTFGGQNLPPVTTFMSGFAAGVARFNSDHGATVEVVGWDPATNSGVFTGSFVDIDAGRATAGVLADSGADIIMPVAGLAGTGAAALATELGTSTLRIIGVDSDQYESDPSNRDVYLTSVIKHTDVTTFEAIGQVVDGTFAGGSQEGTLANGGVGLAPFHTFEGTVPPVLVAELEALRKGIIDGTVKVTN
ncbi:MAG: family transporter substrate-binding protein [Actinomycetota bacterium]|nr:family transporter substrate-binding protein [Actinomycetota bacterium]